MKRRRALAIAFGVFALTSRLGPATTLAAAPDVREVSPADITIDGSAADWDEPAADFLSDMFEAGKPDKDVLSKLYGRYDCATETFYVLVQTVPHWNILPSDNDNYVKLGQTDKLVDGSDGHDGVPPDFAYIGAKAWEAAFHLAPGSYLGDNGLNVHAQVVPDARPSTSAVANRRLDVTIDCSAPPTYADTYADADADSHAHADAHSDTDTDAHTHSILERAPDPDTHADADPDPDADTHADADADTDATPTPTPTPGIDRAISRAPRSIRRSSSRR